MLSKTMIMATMVASTFANSVPYMQSNTCAETTILDIEGTDEKQVVPTCFGANTFILGHCVNKGKEQLKCFIPACENTYARDSGAEDCKLFSGAGGTELKAPVGGAGLAPSPATGSLKATTITDPMLGWKDIKKSRFVNYPPSLIGRRGLIPSVHTGGGYTIEFDCPAGAGGVDELCDAFVFIYRCPPCEFANGGNLPLDLLADDWEPYNCAVKFILDGTVPTYEHNVIVYHRQVAKDTYVDVTPTDLLDYAWFARSPATSHCKFQNNEDDCLNLMPGECLWDAENSVCHRELCPERSQGPDKVHKPGMGEKQTPKGPWVQKCKKCVAEEEAEFVPPVVV